LRVATIFLTAVAGAMVITGVGVKLVNPAELRIYAKTVESESIMMRRATSVFGFLMQLDRGVGIT
jgi:hypothetical protein